MRYYALMHMTAIDKRLGEIQRSLDRNPDIDDWSCDTVRFLLSLIDNLRKENEKLKDEKIYWPNP